MGNGNNFDQDHSLITKNVTTLWPVPPVAFNLLGYVPNKVIYNVSKEKLEADILKVIQNFSPDFKLVRFEVDSRTHQMSLWAWITKNSKDIVDTRYQNRSDLIIQNPMINPSKNMRILQSIFGIRPKGDKNKGENPSSDEAIQRKFNFVKPSNGDNRFVGTEMDLVVVFREMFDWTDRYYVNFYNRISDKKQAVQHSYDLNIAPVIDNHGRCKAFIVSKTTLNPNGVENLHPKQARRLD